MSKHEMHHITLHQSSQMWISLVFLFGILGVSYWYFVKQIKQEFEDPVLAPFVVDLRSEYPTTLDLESRYQFIVRVEKPDGVEVRIYDNDDGHLVGTFIERPTSPSEPVAP